MNTQVHKVAGTQALLRITGSVLSRVPLGELEKMVSEYNLFHCRVYAQSSFILNITSFSQESSS
jgi:hypothetical protein